MGKESGLNDRFYLGGFDLSGDTQTVKNISGEVGVLDVTDITQSANMRIHGMRSALMSWSSYFNPAAGRSHSALSGLSTTDQVMTYGHGVVLGNPAASMMGKQINYDGNRGTDGSFLFSVDGQSSNGAGMNWGVQLTPGLRTDVAASNGTGVDLTTVSTSFGWNAHLHVTAFIGTSVTVTLQDAPDNATWLPITGGSFVAATVPGSQRLDSPTNVSVVRRYVRVVTTGTFTSAVFMVNFVRNDAAAAY